MLNSGGDGGLALGLEIKQFTLYHRQYETLSDANWGAHLLWLENHKCETKVEANSNGKFIIWYRYRS